MLCCRVQNLLSAYCDSELTGAEMLAIRRHLRACPTCQTEHESLRQVKHLLGALSAAEPATAFCAEVLDAAPLSRTAWLRRPRFLPWRVLPPGSAPFQRGSGLSGLRTRLLQQAGPHLAIAGMLAVSGLTLGILRQPQQPDAVHAHVPASIAAEETASENLPPLLPAPPEEPAYYSGFAAGRLARVRPLYPASFDGQPMPVALVHFTQDR